LKTQKLPEDEASAGYQPVGPSASGGSENLLKNRKFFYIILFFPSKNKASGRNVNFLAATSIGLEITSNPRSAKEPRLAPRLLRYFLMRGEIVNLSTI